MKVGIMSMQRVVNYGSYLQAYGLKKIIEELGNEVEFVDYRVEPSLVDDKKKIDVQILEKMKRAVNMLFPAYRKYRQDQIRANQSFDEFYQVFNRTYLPELGVLERRNECPKLDALVIGSDEVFNCTQMGKQVGYSKQLFGAENQANKLISYAACFGSTTLQKLEHYGIRDEIQDYLKQFDALSMRDENSLEIVEKLCGIRAQYHIDPVLLYSFPEVELIHVPIKDYIVVYAYSGRICEEEAVEIKRFAHENGKKLISLGFWQTFCDEYILTTPLETLAYIRNADFVITDTFHGTVFSIKYQKRFGTIIRESNRQKLYDLLKQFDLENHQILKLSEMGKVLEQDINGQRLCNCIKEKQEYALKYLKEQLA